MIFKVMKEYSAALVDTVTKTYNRTLLDFFDIYLKSFLEYGIYQH